LKITAYLGILSLHLPGDTKEKYEKLSVRIHNNLDDILICYRLNRILEHHNYTYLHYYKKIAESSCLASPILNPITGHNLRPLIGILYFRDHKTHLFSLENIV
jgi:hypothetical protein